jgi:hypothetical protein
MVNDHPKDAPVLYENIRRGPSKGTNVTDCGLVGNSSTADPGLAQSGDSRPKRNVEAAAAVVLRRQVPSPA